MDLFRRRFTGQEKRQTVCASCQTVQLRQLRAAKRHQELGLMATDVNHYADRPGRIQRILEEMIRRFHGPDNFCQEWYAAYVTARDAGKLHLASRHLNAVLNLSTAANCERRQETDAMSFDDVHRAARDELLALIQDQPELVMEAARSIGWRVEPPTVPTDETERTVSSQLSSESLDGP